MEHKLLNNEHFVLTKNGQSVNVDEFQQILDELIPALSAEVQSIKQASLDLDVQLEAALNNIAVLNESVVEKDEWKDDILWIDTMTWPAGYNPIRP